MAVIAAAGAAGPGTAPSLVQSGPGWHEFETCQRTSDAPRACRCCFADSLGGKTGFSTTLVFLCQCFQCISKSNPADAATRRTPMAAAVTLEVTGSVASRHPFVHHSPCTAGQCWAVVNGDDNVNSLMIWNLGFCSLLCGRYRRCAYPGRTVLVVTARRPAVHALPSPSAPCRAPTSV